MQDVRCSISVHNGSGHAGSGLYGVYPSHRIEQFYYYVGQQIKALYTNPCL